MLMRLSIPVDGVVQVCDKASCFLGANHDTLTATFGDVAGNQTLDVRWVHLAHHVAGCLADTKFATRQRTRSPSERQFSLKWVSKSHHGFCGFRV